MSDLNSWSFTGRLGRDPEMNYSNKGTAYTRFSVAVAGWNSSLGGATTLWINCVAFGAIAENINMYYKKGTQIAATGSVDLRTWEKDGRSGSSLDVKISEIHMVGNPKNGGPSGDVNKEHTTNAQTVVTEVETPEGDYKF